MGVAPPSIRADLGGSIEALEFGEVVGAVTERSRGILLGRTTNEMLEPVAVEADRGDVNA